MLAAFLAGCGRQNQTDDSTNDPLAASSSRQEDRFGEGFGTAYRAEPNSEPRNVSDADVTPLSTTTDPIDIE
ncbi:hypothetical protein H8M03_06445 [Sphingomonas sabuli]|uniref:Uncharacterized protein n=1 Tax=Sphingomonas sabuli TaxID=2764186 RepID=A0A7G9KZB4_9SPHN|nr:hypothetical protein [Sphingomonas sabuli]QNM81713.1 hypothetical protein H8M03_06445 [Sphingomonas sabuli]